jgi:hypothetical protein
MRAAALVLLALATVWPRWRWVRGLLAAAGGALLVIAVWDVSLAGRDLAWAVPAAVAAVVGVWWAAPIAHTRLPLATAWVLLAGCAGAVYLCVPETDQLREVAVVTVGGAVAEMLLRRRLPVPAVVAAGALVLWGALFGAVGRPSAMVGGLFALLPVVAVAVVAVVAARCSRVRLVIVAAVWVAAAAVMARTGGLAHSLTDALLAAVACAAVAALGSAVLCRSAPR